MKTMLLILNLWLTGITFAAEAPEVEGAPHGVSVVVGLGSPMNYLFGLMVGFVHGYTRFSLGTGTLADGGEKLTGIAAGFEVFPTMREARPFAGIQATTDVTGRRRETSLSVRVGGEATSEECFLFRYGLQYGLPVQGKTKLIPFIEVGASF